MDKLLLRQVLNAASSCPIEALYLEMGCIPIGLIIKARRLNYLHYLVSRRENEMLHNFFITQWKYPVVRGEWKEQVKLDLSEFDIVEDLQWIKSKSKLAFHKMVKAQAREFTLDINK